MNKRIVVRGKIKSGTRQAERFTQLAWVQTQCHEKLGFRPYPGTLNLELDEENVTAFERIRKQKGKPLIPPDPSFCRAKTIPVSIGSIHAAVIIPATEARLYSNHIVEIIAPFHLKQLLGVKDGDHLDLIYDHADHLNGTLNLAAEMSSSAKRQIPGKNVQKMFPGRGEKRCEAVVFDLDGTLINSIEFYRKIIQEVFGRLNLPPLSDAAFIAAMQQGNFAWEEVMPDVIASKPNEIIKAADRIARSIFAERSQKEIRLIPGTKEVLIKLSEAGIKIGLVTSTHKKSLAKKFTPFVQNGIASLFETVITSDDVPKVKPAADPLIKALKNLGVPIDTSVYIGDTCVDIQAGKAAGMKTIAVLTGVGSYEDLKREAPDAIIESVAQLASWGNITGSN